ncbi:hypothetical protein HDV04_004917 [Boothiomyces sp. JEL0838]|nr:hypothetical protein HDV04_004902 [Boothiomyces sp. JEL0838]KAJ3310589.1 hypothetical protein HDV04_004917 [Boothiomyces sp. JEL0838]
MIFLIAVALALSATAIKPNNIQHLTHAGNTSQNNIISAHLNYYGGPVISKVKVYTIFWGGKAKVKYANQINEFYKGFTNSVMFDMLSQYSTIGNKIGRGTFIGSFDYAGAVTGTITDTLIQTTLKSLILACKIPKPDANTYYAIHFAPGITIVQPGGDTSCEEFCAYHSTIQNVGGYIYYGIIPDQGGNCATGCGNDPLPFNNLCSVSSHELVEAVTDPAVGLATAYASPLAWYDPMNGEIGDICNANQGKIVGGNGITYVVQKEWSNKANACIIPTVVSKTTITAKPSLTIKHTSTAKPTPTLTGCAHSKCVQGIKLVPTCDPCVAKIIAADSYCGTEQWDKICVAEVKTICGITC